MPHASCRTCVIYELLQKMTAMNLLFFWRPCHLKKYQDMPIGLRRSKANFISPVERYSCGAQALTALRVWPVPCQALFMRVSNLMRCGSWNVLKNLTLNSSHWLRRIVWSDLPVLLMLLSALVVSFLLPSYLLWYHCLPLLLCSYYWFCVCECLLHCLIRFTSPFNVLVSSCCTHPVTFLSSMIPLPPTVTMQPLLVLCLWMFALSEKIS